MVNNTNTLTNTVTPTNTPTFSTRREAMDYYFDKPRQFMLDCFPWGKPGTWLEDYALEKWQGDVAEDIVQWLKDNPDESVCKVAISSGRGIGKTAFASLIILWFIYTRDMANINLFANNDMQLKSTLWREMSKWFSVFKYKKHFTITNGKLYDNNHNDWAVYPKTWDLNNLEGARGQHGGNDRQMLVGDEASGFPVPIYEAMKGGFSEKRGIMLFISNPNPKGEGWFADIFLDKRFGKGWLKYEIDSRHVSITNKKNIAEDIEKYGEDSDYVNVHIRGKQIEQFDDRFFLREMVKRAMNKIVSQAELARDAVMPRIAGVDIGGSGDPTEIAIRQGSHVEEFTFRPSNKQDLEITAQEIINYLEKVGYDYLVVDAYGIGFNMKTALQRYGAMNVYEYGPSSSWDRMRFNSKRAECHMRMKQWLNKGGKLPMDSRLETEMLAQREKKTDNGKFALLEKRELRRLYLKGTSPNKCDSIAMTFLLDFERMGRKGLTRRMRRARLINNGNPFNRR